MLFDVMFYIFILSILTLSTFLFLYPAYLCMRNMKISPMTPEPMSAKEYSPSVSIVVAVRNGETLISDKIENFTALNYPKEKIEIVIISDGSTDKTNEIATENIKDLNISDRATLLICDSHIGKAKALNQATQHATGEILVFTDADAILETSAIQQLVRHFVNQNIGGVCGLRVLIKENNKHRDNQQKYISLDTWIKIQEAKIGSITSNDGKLYALRRSLFCDIIEGVTDDLFSALSIVSQGYRFTFDSTAIAHVRVPSRTISHEVARRRRITCRSLRGIFMHIKLLNPLKFGGYGYALCINKVIRRFTPFLFLMIMITSLFLSPKYPGLLLVFLTQLSIIFLALCHPFVNSIKLISPISSKLHFIYFGNLGIFLGLIDFLMGKKIVMWDPKKTDNL